MLGLDPEQARDANQHDESDQVEDTYELAPELWDAWQCFVATWNQWRVVVGFAGGHYEGIDHSALHSSMQMLGIRKRKWAEVYHQVLILENEARRLRNQKQ